MSRSSDTGRSTLPDSPFWFLSRGRVALVVSVILAFVAIFLIYNDGISLMVRWWDRDEYSHGYMIPLVALFMFWQRVPQLAKSKIRPTFLALCLLLVALAGAVLGELSALYTIIQYSFLLAIYAVVLALLGLRGTWTIWPALVYLVFMIPLPNFLYNNLSQQLQLISSELGVWFIRLFGISVYLEGNVIDLGSYQLQVAEACSGLRYLFPLMSFGFLIAYLYQGPHWHKWVIFLSTPLITVLMNSFRIALIGVTVKYWGSEMADGFLHDFEGWVVFIACLALLGLEIWFLNIITGNGRPLADLLDLSYPSLHENRAALVSANFQFNPVWLGTVLLLLIAVPVSISLKDRVEFIPERSAFSSFPLVRNDWMGQESAIEADVLNELNLTDYIMAEYRRGSSEQPVNFYVAYYQSQRKGSSIHSPRSCIPGGGWVIADHSLRSVKGLTGAEGLTVNRLVIQKGAYRQLVYYWFDQRGRTITNEYLAKWYLFLDSLMEQRTDGALVRLVTSVPQDDDISIADERLVDFMQDFQPLLQDYVPRK